MDVAFDDLPPSASPDRAALIGDDAQKPRTDSTPITELPDLAPGLHRRFLHGVFGQCAVEEHADGQPEGRLEQRS